jgi:hypothetical protein
LHLSFCFCQHTFSSPITTTLSASLSLAHTHSHTHSHTQTHMHPHRNTLRYNISSCYSQFGGYATLGIPSFHF